MHLKSLHQWILAYCSYQNYVPFLCLAPTTGWLSGQYMLRLVLINSLHFKSPPWKNRVCDSKQQSDGFIYFKLLFGITRVDGQVVMAFALHSKVVGSNLGLGRRFSLLGTEWYVHPKCQERQHHNPKLQLPHKQWATAVWKCFLQLS